MWTRRRTPEKPGSADLRPSLLTATVALALLIACDRGGAPASSGEDENPPVQDAQAAEAEERGPDVALPDSASFLEIDSSSAEDERPRRVVEEYYAAIAAEEYERAFAFWGDRGRSSGQTFLEFVAGFAVTDEVSVTTGEPRSVEGAAGSHYVEVPVVVRAITNRGDRQRFEGSYTLRRSVVDGAMPEQRQWKLYDASLTQVR